MIFAPLSELYGRRIMYVTTLLVGIVFIIPGAVAKNIVTILVARAIDGIGFRQATHCTSSDLKLTYTSHLAHR